MIISQARSDALHSSTMSNRAGISTPSTSVRQEVAVVSIAVYRPTDDRDPPHWAISICSPTHRRTIQQIALDPHDNYCVDRIRWRARPCRSALHDFDLECSTIPSSLVAAARQLIQMHGVNNNSRTWNCQEWVLECVVLLVRARILRARWLSIQRIRRLRQKWQ